MRKYFISVSIVLMLAMFALIEYYLRMKFGTKTDATMYKWFLWARGFLLVICAAKVIANLRKEENGFYRIWHFSWCLIFFIIAPAMVIYVSTIYWQTIGKIFLSVIGLFVGLCFLIGLASEVFRSETDEEAYWRQQNDWLRRR